MRVILTELFFERVIEMGAGASKAVQRNPGIGIAFFGGDTLACTRFG